VLVGFEAVVVSVYLCPAMCPPTTMVVVVVVVVGKPKV